MFQMKRISILLFAVLTIACSKDDKPVELSTKNLITSFSLNIDGETYDGEIDQQERTINFETEGRDISSLKPSIIFSERARIEPSPNLAQDFREEVSYTVYAENGTPNVYRIQVNNRPVSTKNEINTFTFEIEGNTIEAVIDREAGIIRADVPLSDISSLTPQISIPEYASINPPAGDAKDFTTPVTYRVTAENGDVRTYVVQLNEPAIESIILAYSPEPTFYIGAEAGIAGRYLMNEGETPEIYLYDGTNRFELENLEYHFSYEDTGTAVRYFTVTFVIPDDIPTNVYTIVLEKRGYRVVYDGFDVMAENAPDPQSLSQEVFTKDDALKIYGENLTGRIVIPSDGSHYLLWQTYSVDITVNIERTELTFVPNYRQHNLYPSYYGREPEEKKITFFDESGRVGRSIKTIFK